MKDFKRMSYDDIRLIFEKLWDQIHSFVPMDSEEEVPRLKRAGQDVETKPAKRQRTKEVSESVQEQTDEEPKTDDTMHIWKIIRVGNHTEIYQVFEDMLKNFDRDDLDKLWSLVQERYNSSGLAEDKEIELWEVIEYGNSFKPIARTITNVDGSSTSTIPGPVTTKEKAQKKNDVKEVNKKCNPQALIFQVYQECGLSINSVGGGARTNEDNTANVQVSTASTNDSTASLSDATIYAFFANQPNGSQVVHEDLEQIHKDDLEEMDLKWQLALLSLKERKFYHRTGPRNQESRPRNQESSKRTVNVEDTSSKAMVAFDEAGFDWSFMADEEVPTNLALMAFSDSEVLGYEDWTGAVTDINEDGFCSYDNLTPSNVIKGLFAPSTIDLSSSDLKEFQQPEFEGYGVNVSDCDEDESEVMVSDNVQHKSELKPEQAKHMMLMGWWCDVGGEWWFRCGEAAALMVVKLGGGGKWRVGGDVSMGSGLFAPPTTDLSSSRLKEFQQPEFEGYGVNVNKSVSKNSSNEIKKTIGAPIIEDWVSDCDEDESEMVQKPMMNNVQKETRVWNNALRTNHQNFSNSRRNFSPTAVLTKSGKVPISTVRQSSSRATAPVSAVRPINTAAPKSFVNVAKPKPNAFQKAHSLSRRPFNQQIALNNRILNNKVNTAKVNSVNTAKEKRVTSAVREQGINAVKTSACWVWRPKRNVVDHVSKNSGSYICKQF
ncbi:hypothetical protein Tco_0778675, partial [Tanacetum coccineum]